MTGSAVDGEDVVQETLARAYYELSELQEMPALRAWLFRIAHNRAIDHLRRFERRIGQPLDGAVDLTAVDARDADDVLAAAEAVRTAMSRFVEVAPLQRSCVILKDVLGHSIDEIAVMLETSVPAVKAALHRGRARLRALSGTAPAPPRPVSPAVARYAAMFNARDWDGVRAMLLDDVKLDLVSKMKSAGRRQVSGYFSNYESIDGWRVVAGQLEGREGLLVFRQREDQRPSYFVELRVRSGAIAGTRHYRYVPYLLQEAAPG